MKQLCGEQYNAFLPQDKNRKKCLKIAHVGMSRPTHLLCVALNRNIVNNNWSGLVKNGWKLV